MPEFNQPASERQDSAKAQAARIMAYQFIQQNPAGALATVSMFGIPDVAIVYCVVQEDLTLYFSTQVEGRKFVNLKTQSAVAMAFSDEQTMTTVQVTGLAERVENLNLEQAMLQAIILLRHGKPDCFLPPMQLFEHGASSEIAVIRVVPLQMTYADFTITNDGRHKPFFKKIL